MHSILVGSIKIFQIKKLGDSSYFIHVIYLLCIQPNINYNKYLCIAHRYFVSSYFIIINSSILFIMIIFFLS